MGVVAMSPSAVVRMAHKSPERLLAFALAALERV
jgi:hypothetical protein